MAPRNTINPNILREMPKQYFKKLRRIGQSTAEYAVLLAIVAVALVSMQLYIKRSIQGRLRDLANQLAPGRTPSGASQYEGRRTSSYTTTQTGTTIELSDSVTANVYQDGNYNSVPETITRSGNESTTIETQ